MVTVLALDLICIDTKRIAVSQQRHNTQWACARTVAIANNRMSFLVDALPGSKLIHHLLRLVVKLIRPVVSFIDHVPGMNAGAVAAHRI